MVVDENENDVARFGVGDAIDLDVLGVDVACDYGGEQREGDDGFLIDLHGGFSGKVE